MSKDENTATFLEPNREPTVANTITVEKSMPTPQQFKDDTIKFVVRYWTYLMALIVALVILYIVCYHREKFTGPNIRNQVLERLDSTAPAQSTPTYFDPDALAGVSIPTFKPDPNAAPGAPGSMAALVLGSSDMQCSNAANIPTDAYSWMTDNMGSASTAAIPSTGSTENFTDNDLSAIAQGHSRISRH